MSQIDVMSDIWRVCYGMNCRGINRRRRQFMLMFAAWIVADMNFRWHELSPGDNLCWCSRHKLSPEVFAFILASERSVVGVNFSYRYDDYNRDETNKINQYSEEINIVYCTSCLKCSYSLVNYFKRNFEHIFMTPQINLVQHEPKFKGYHTIFGVKTV